MLLNENPSYWHTSWVVCLKDKNRRKVWRSDLLWNDSSSSSMLAIIHWNYSVAGLYCNVWYVLFTLVVVNIKSPWALWRELIHIFFCLLGFFWERGECIFRIKLLFLIFLVFLSHFPCVCCRSGEQCTRYTIVWFQSKSQVISSCFVWTDLLTCLKATHVFPCTF